MRRMTFIVWVVVAAVSLGGCMVSKKNYTQLQSDYTALEKQHQQISGDLAATQSSTAKTIEQKNERIAALEKELADAAAAAKAKEESLRGEMAQLETQTTQQEATVSALTAQADQLEEQLKEEIASGQIRLKRYKTKTVINMDNSILFDSGSANLKKSVAIALKKIATSLQEFTDNSIQIEGHTDDVPIHTDRFASNWELSSARALAVVRFFVDDLAVDPQRLSAVGYGQYHPLAPNSTAANRRQNRRVDIVILPK